MHFPLWQRVRTFLAGILVIIFAVPSNLAAQIHVVSPSDLQQETMAASQARARDLQTVTQFLSSERAQQALKSAHINPTQVKVGISSLSDEELARLASRSAKAE